MKSALRQVMEADLISSEALAEDFIQTRLDLILQSRISFILRIFLLLFLINNEIDKLSIK